MFSFTLINRSYLHFILLLTICSIIFSSDIYNNSWAVIVGIDEYTGEGLKELHYAVNDAEDIRKVLIEYHNINSENITLLLNADATKEKIEEALYNYYKQADYEDRIIFYFAGHGVTVPTADGGEMGYLVPADIKNKDQIVLKGIDMQSLKKLTYHANAKHILFLIDACYGGLAAVGSRGLEFKKVGDANWRKITKGKVRKIITAGRKDEPVIEKSEWGHSAFARNVLRGIGEDRAADLDNNDYITSEELGVYLKTKVSEDTDGEQTPQSDRLTSDDGEFVFIFNNGKAEALRGYNDDLVMSLAIGLWIRETALRLYDDEMQMTRQTMEKIDSNVGVYKVEHQVDLGWDMPVGDRRESLTWLIGNKE